MNEDGDRASEQPRGEALYVRVQTRKGHMTNRLKLPAWALAATTLFAAAASAAGPDAAARDFIRDRLVGPAAGATTRPHGPDGPERSDGKEVQAAIEKWTAVNGESVRVVGAGPLKDLPWGACTCRLGNDGKPELLYLHVFDWHNSGEVIAYGLGADVKRAYLLADPKADLPVTKTDRLVKVQGPKKPPDPIDTVVVLELRGEPKVVSVAVDPSPDGTILLHARDSIVHGVNVRYEPDPHKNTVGYWTNPADWVSWEFNVPAPGRYSVEILQGCGKGSGGSVVDFAAAGQVLTVTVQDTGGFQNFVPRDIGEFRFEKAGRYTLSVKPTKKPGAAVMDLRQVVLKPVK